MEQNERQQEGNILIAEFMGGKKCKGGPYGHFYAGMQGIGVCDPHELKYDKDWKWLIPVVEKIEATPAFIYTGFTVEIRGTLCAIICHTQGKQGGCIYQTPYGFEPERKIQAVWLAVVEFIKWHKEHKIEDQSNHQ